MWRSTRGFEESTLGFKDCHTKIGDADVAVFVEEEVLRLKVPVTSN